MKKLFKILTFLFISTWSIGQMDIPKLSDTKDIVYSSYYNIYGCLYSNVEKLHNIPFTFWYWQSCNQQGQLNSKSVRIDDKTGLLTTNPNKGYFVAKDSALAHVPYRFTNYSSSPLLPDLIVTNITYSPSSPVSSDSVAFTATIKNVGTTATPANTVIGILFTVDNSQTVFTWSDTSKISLAVNATRTLTANYGTGGKRKWYATSGTHTVEAYANDNNRFNEVDRGNNKLTKTFTVGSPTGTANLAIYSIPEPLNSVLKGTNRPTTNNTIRFDNLFSDITPISNGVYTVWTDLPQFKENWFNGGNDINKPLKKGGFNATGHGQNYSLTSVPTSNRYNWNSVKLKPSGATTEIAYPYNFWVDNYLSVHGSNAPDDYQFGKDYFDGSGVLATYDPNTNAYYYTNHYQFDYEVYNYGGVSIAGNYNFSKEFFKGFLDRAKTRLSSKFYLTLYGWNLVGEIIDQTPATNNAVYPLITNNSSTLTSYKTCISGVADVINRLKDTASNAPLVALEYGYYYKTSYPENVTKYKLDGSGNVIRDANNRPFFRTDDFTDIVRGETTTFRYKPEFNRVTTSDALTTDALDVFQATAGQSTAGDNTAHVGIRYANGSFRADAYTDNIWYWWMRPGVHTATWMPYRHFSKLVTGRIGLNKVLNGREDFENDLYNTANIILNSTFRWMTEGCETEPTDGAMSEKQLSPFQLNMFYWQTLAINRGIQFWSGNLSYYDNSEVSGGYSGNNQTQNITIYNPSQGRDNPNYATGNAGTLRWITDVFGNRIAPDYSQPNYSRDMSVAEQILALQQTAKRLNTDYGFFSNGDALWVFTDWKNTANEDVIAVGLKHNDKAVLFMANPQLDVKIPTQTITVGYGSTTIGTYTLKNATCEPVIVTLPSSALTGSDVWIQYTNILGATIKKNGKFQSI